jgi:hypothetical protein
MGRSFLSIQSFRSIQGLQVAKIAAAARRDSASPIVLGERRREVRPRFVQISFFQRRMKVP